MVRTGSYGMNEGTSKKWPGHTKQQCTRGENVCFVKTSHFLFYVVFILLFYTFILTVVTTLSMYFHYWILSPLGEGHVPSFEQTVVPVI